MHIFPTLFLLTLLTGSLIRIPLFFNVMIYPHDIALCIYLLSWFIWKIGKKETIVFSPFIKPLAIFMAALLVSFLVNAFGHTVEECVHGISYSIRMLLYMGLYIIISNTKNPLFWLKRLYGIGVIFGIAGIVQYILYPNLRNLEYLGWDPHYYRLFSTFLDPNFAGLFLVLTFLLGFSFIFKRQERLEYVLFQAIVLTALLLTLSRSSYSAFVASVSVYLWWKKSWKLLAGIILFIIVVFYTPFPQKSVTPLLRGETIKARMENWAYSMDLFKKKPVFGYGFNLLRTIQEPGLSTKEPFQISHASGGVDNSFLFVLVTSGIVGGICFIRFCISLWNMGKKLAETKKERRLGMIFLISLVAIAAHSMFVNSFFYPWILIWLWIVTGVVEKKVTCNCSDS